MARPVADFARRSAQEAGDKRYHGNVCGACGGNERFTASGMCVVCLPRKTKAWRARNPEHLRAYQRGYEQRNATAVAATRAVYRSKHRDERRTASSLWKKKNPHRNTAVQMKRQASQTRRTPPWLTQAHYAEMDGMYHFARLMSVVTGRKHHVDHIVPLQGKTVAGLHVPWNLQALPATVNQQKSNSLVVN